MFENYSVAVAIRLTNHVSAGLLLISQQFAATDAAAAKFQKSLNSIQSMAKGGAYLLGGGLALAAPFIFAIDKAAELQKQMIAIQLATRGTTGEMDRMRSAIEGIASQTVFSNIDIAKMGKLIATGTGLSASGVTGLLPVVGKLADVQTLMKGTPYEQTTNTLVRLAHLAGHYDAGSLGKYADLLNKASLIVPGGLGEVANALQYSQGIGKNALGIDDENMILMSALLNRMGLKGSRGGTNLIAAMSRTIPGIFGSGLLKGKSNEALSAMGMIDSHGHSKAFTNGKFDAFTWMGLMSEYVQREFASHPEAIARQDIMKNFQHAFGVQGGRVASLLSSRQAIEQFRQIGGTFAEMGGVESMQHTFADQSVAQQWMNAKTNFMSALTELGMTLLPMASKALKALNIELAKVIEWITKHQQATKLLAEGFLALSGVMMLGGVSLLTTAGVRGLFLMAQGMGAVFTSLGTLGAVLGGLSAVLGAGALGWLIGKWANNKFNLSSRIGDAVEAFTGGGYDPNGHPKGATHYVGKGGSAITLHTTIQMDGKKVATAVSKHQANAASAPQTGVSDFDSRLNLLPAGGLGY